MSHEHDKACAHCGNFIDEYAEQCFRCEGIQPDHHEKMETIRHDAERYRKLRDMGDHQTFGEYVVVKCEGLPVGTQTWSGKRLDAMLDEMEAADAKPE